jgi:hypothetical protein
MEDDAAEVETETDEGLGEGAVDTVEAAHPVREKNKTKIRRRKDMGSEERLSTSVYSGGFEGF